MFDQPASCDPDELTPDEKVEALIAEDQRKRKILEGAQYELEKREMRRLADALERQNDRKPQWLSLTEQLRRPLTEQVYSIDRLLPLGGNALFAGRYKAGKTTFNGQLLKAWADNVPFLGEFDVHPDPERPCVTIFNYEMSEDQFHRWLSSVGIENTDNVNIVHLRGMHTSLEIPSVRAELAARLADCGTGLWVVDPASRAFGGDVTSNAEVTAWLALLDEVKMEAGVRDLVLNIHMPHSANSNSREAQERAIGAQAWPAWADALWFLNFDKDQNRQFWASGRDVEFDRAYVHYDESNRSVLLLPNAPDPAQMADETMRKLIMLAVQNNDGISENRIMKEYRGQGGTGKAEAIRGCIKDLELEGYLLIRPGGKGKATSHHTVASRPYLPATSSPGTN